MKRLVLAVAFVWWMGWVGQTAYADQTVYAQVPGVEWATDDYEAVPLTWVDAGALAGIVASFAIAANVTSPLVIQALPAVAVASWGAWRTNQYRPAEVMAEIRERVAARTTTSHPGGYPGF